MSLDRAKNKVPLRDKSKPLSYDAEALLFIRLIVKPNVPKVTKRDWCLIREVDVHKFSTSYSRIHKETFKRKSVQRKNETTLQKVQRINRRLDKNIIEKQDVEEYIEDIKKAHSVPNKKRKKEDKKGSENGTNEEKIGQNTELFGENAKHSEPEKGTEQEKEDKNEQNDNDNGYIPIRDVLYHEVTTRNDDQFNIHTSRWRTLQACAYALEDLSFRLTYQAQLTRKPAEMRQIAATIRDVQQSYRDMVPDYLASKERMGVIMVLEALKTGQIDVVEAAISFDIAGVPMPDSVKMLMQKYIEPEKEEEKPMITHEEIERRRLEVLENIKSQMEYQPTKALEVSALKDELKGQLSYDMEKEEKEE